MMSIAANNISIATQKLKSAMQASGVTISIDDNKVQQQINLVEVPQEFLKALMQETLSKGQRIQISAALGNKAGAFDEMCVTPAQLNKVLQTLVSPTEMHLEVQIGSKWYPMPLTQVSQHSDQFFGASAYLQLAAVICGQGWSKSARWVDDDFRNDDGSQRPRQVRELLGEFGIRQASPETIEAFRRKTALVGKIANKTGTPMAAKGPVLAFNKMIWQGSLDEIALGSEDRPRMVIVDAELEAGHQNQVWYSNNQQQHNLPFVRVFSLSLKKYVFADVDELGSWTFDRSATDRLVLPAKMSTILNKIFDASTSEIFGDLFRGRHGGMVVLANGPQGVGKTLTAEVFAEKTQRPLYVLEMGELGTNLASVEESLQKVFTRAARWNAVLLFDEADVFLAKRQETDLERSAIVGVFLRLLDRYEGMFFLTTNRAAVIDTAFRSRITLKLDYPELDADARKRVWEEMIRSADLHVSGDLAPVFAKKIDGRQIRNQVRLLKVMHNGNEIGVEDVLESLQYVVTD